jgi:hypothetical protein
MPITPTTLKPGLLVAMRTAIGGDNVRYLKEIIRPRTKAEGDSGYVEAWKTEKSVADSREYEAAKVARSKVCSLVTSVCSRTSFGHLCPQDRADALEEKIAEARALVEDFNRSAKVTNVAFNFVIGRVAADDQEAVAAVRAELGDLLIEMRAGISGVDIDGIRRAAKRARNVSQMLEPGMQERVGEAVAVARKAASKLAKAGEEAAATVDADSMAAIESVRMAVLDLDPTAIEPVAAAVSDGRQLDLGDAPAIAQETEAKSRKPRKRKAEARQLDIEESR